MCQGDDRNCPDFEEHRQNFLSTMDHERRSFLKSAFAAAGGAGVLGAGGLSLVTPSDGRRRPGAPAGADQPLPHAGDGGDGPLGLFQQEAAGQGRDSPGDYVTIETLTHHAYDDVERMVKGDPGAESVFHWRDKKNVDRRGAGPMDASLSAAAPARDSASTCAPGPWPSGSGARRHVGSPHRRHGAAPSANPKFAGKNFGSNAAAWWGYQYKDLLTEPKEREVVTIYEIDAARRAELGQGDLQLPLDTADRSVRRRPQDHRLSRRSGRSLDHQEERGHSEERAHAGSPAFRRDGGGA